MTSLMIRFVEKLKISITALVILFSASASFGTSIYADEAPEKVSDFALLDHTGKYHHLGYYGDLQAVALLVHSKDDPVATASADAFAQLQTEYADEDVVFLMLNPVDERSELAAKVDSSEELHTTKADNSIPILVDDAQLVAQTLGVTHIGEALLIDPQSKTILYRGPVDSSGAGKTASSSGGYLKNALAAAVAGTPFNAKAVELQGATLNYTHRTIAHDNKVSYTKDIVPILERNCISCHHEGGIGPWSMSSHAMVQGWSPMMREVVMTRRMPPGQIDTHVGKPITDVAGLTIDERQKLINWIDAGAPKDGDIDPLTALTFDNPKFTFGEPDLVFKVPAQTIPATGLVDYRYIPVELNLDEDVWVQAMEFVPGDRQVLHHVIAYLSSPPDKSARGRDTGAPRGASIGGFAPGRPGDIFRDNSGRLIKKGSNLLLQMHYTTSGKVAVDETEIAIYLHDEPPAHVMAEGVAGQRRFLVPPFVKEHLIEGEQIIERDAYLYSMTPHMHFRGKHMKYVAEYPDGSSEVLLSVPKYDFNWQYSYELQQPLFLPEGTRVVAHGAMDNSDRNPGNPDPSKPVHFGLQTKHEMFFGFLTLRYEGDTPENIAADRSITASPPPAAE